MRFVLGLLGGVICALLVLVLLDGFSSVAGRNGAPALPAVCKLVLQHGRCLSGLLIFLCFGATLGGLFTSGMCGRMATGPAIMVGLVYGVMIWLFMVFLLLPAIAYEVPPPVSSGAIAASSLIYGALMGIWVIAAAHIWPSMAGRCGEASEGTQPPGEEA